MKHIFEATHLASDKVFIFGKGPSFNRNAEIPEGCKVYCINQTVNQFLTVGVPIDLVVFNNLEPLIDVISKRSFQNLAFPYSIHKNEIPTNGHGPTVPEIVEGLGHDAWMFDLSGHKFQSFIEHHPIKAFTTYNTALSIALHHGAKTVYTNGIDGGKGRHESFLGTHQTFEPNYDAQFEEEKRMLEQYNAKVVRVL
jgi:hypothetical protein